MSFEDKTSILNLKALPVKANEPNRSACFIVLTGSQAGRMYKLDREQLVIGRGSEAAIRIEDDGVSRRHAKIIQGQAGEVYLEDLGSTNGTFCNGQKLSQQALQDGDKIQIGTTTILKFSYQDSLEQDFQQRQYESVTRDGLTAVFNKKYFLERLPSEVSFAQRHQKSLALAMFDVDHFKRINDTHGHQAGDYVLRELAATVLAQIRSDDVLSRYGGEEFGLIMRETTIEAALIVAERVRKRVEAARFEFESKVIPVTISLGVAVLTHGSGMDAEGLIRASDELLYKAKRRGRNRTEGDAVP